MDDTTNLLDQAVMVLADRLAGATRLASGLGDTAAVALLAVVRCPGEPVEALAARLKLTAAGATRVLDGLQGNGLIRRTRTGADGRARLVEPTTQGRRLAFSVEQARHAELARALQAFSPNDRTEVSRLMARLLAASNNESDRAAG